MFYVTRIHGPMALKVPTMLLGLCIVSRAIGLGTLAPMFAIIRGGWVVVRSWIDFITNSGGTTDGWYRAFLISLTWPLMSMLKMGWVLFSPAITNGSRDGECIGDSVYGATTPSRRSNATAHTASDSASSRRSVEQTIGKEFCADGLLLKKQNDRGWAGALASEKCGNRPAKWRRVIGDDGRAPGR